MTQTTFISNQVKVKLERGNPDDLFVSDLAGVETKVAQDENKRAMEDQEFRHSIEQTMAEGGRSNYIQICAPFELYALTKIKKPRHIVEVGVAAGVSSAYFLRGLQSLGSEGVLHSIDMPEHESESRLTRCKISWALPPGKRSGWAVPRNLRENWDLRLGKSSDVLPDLIREIGRVDLFLYDVPYEIEGAKEDFRIVDQKLRKGSIVLADNCLVPISWWAKRRSAARIYKRKNSGLRGFSVA
jgi:predicted O-methyltransferase YrrM